MSFDKNSDKKIVARIDRMIDRRDSNVKAIASINIANCFAVHGIKVIEGDKGRFVSMPQNSFKTKSGTTQYSDVCHPITASARTEMLNAVMESYEERLHMSEDEAPDNIIEPTM